MNVARIALACTLIPWLALAAPTHSISSCAAQQTPSPAAERTNVDSVAADQQPASAESDTASKPERQQLTAEQINQAANQAADEADLDEETRTRVAEQFRQAIVAVERSNEFGQRASTFTSLAQTAAERASNLKLQIDQLRGTDPPSVDDSQSLTELEQQLTQREADVAKLQQSIAKADTEIASRTERRKTIRARLTEIEEALEKLQPQLNQPPPDGESATVSTARQMELQAQFQRLSAEPAALSAELAAYDAEDAVDLVRLNRDLARLELTNGEAVLSSLQDLIQSLRAREASRQVTAAAELAESETNPQLKRIAQRNVELAEQFKQLTVQIGEVEDQLNSAKATRDQWSRAAKSAKDKVSAIGLTNAIGAMLRQQKSSLPNAAIYQDRIERRQVKVADAQLALLDLEEERSYGPEALESKDFDAAVEQRYSDLVTKQSENLSKLTRIQRNYFDRLIELSSTESQIISDTFDYENFIDERILWVRSSPPLYDSFGILGESSGSFDRRRLAQTWDTIAADIHAGALWYVAAAVGFLALITIGPRLRANISSLGTQAESFSCISMSPTIQATSYTILATLPWPMLFAFVAWRFNKLPTDDALVHSLAEGCSSVAAAYLPLEFFRRACQEKGLVQSHFNWTSQSVTYVRRSIRSLMLVGLPLTMVVAILHSDGMRLGRDNIERLLFLLAMIALSRFASRLSHPRKGIFSGHLRRRPDGWAARLQVFWYWSMVVGPLLLGVVSFMGYAYTAHQLAWRLFGTVVLLALVSFATAFLTRALLVQRRRVSMDTARQLREANLKTHELATDEIDIPTAEELRSQIAQSRSLLRTAMVGIALLGIWMTWVDVLPALELLEQKPLWRSIKTIAQMETNEQGDAQFVTHDVVDNVTIADVAFAIIIAIGTAIAAKNIPGLLEIAVLKRLPIEPSVRYAIETVASYVIMVLGLVVVCSSLGIHWKQVQWMAAALTFGLAFGLQEMFANFVAGIIILVERPVRVGDIVTVDNVTGTVSRVQIRATTITNWDRKDYLVPNKDFITGRVLNWTLSNRFNRIVIPVGVAYGSDKNETVQQMLRVATEHPQIVDDPGPSVTFEEFANSSLNYVLRCYISMDDISSRLSIVHELHTGIDDAFRQAKIEIPFPQQDVHVRSVTADTNLRVTADPKLVEGKNRSDQAD